MRISELSEATGMPIATLKFYLREGVLHGGSPRAKTQASYDQSHVDRVRLVRALTEVGGLSIAATRRVVDAINDPQSDRATILRAAQESVAPAVIVPREHHPLATHLLGELGWYHLPGDQMIDLLERQLEVIFAAQIGITDELLVGLGELAHRIAVIDLADIPQDPAAAVRQVVLGTALVDKVIVTLRRLAQTEVAYRATMDEQAVTAPISD